MSRNSIEGLTPIPPDERHSLRWNADPFYLDRGGGYEEYDPGHWLLPYWMGRYYGFICNSTEILNQKLRS